jgi:hypothetical protein
MNRHPVTVEGLWAERLGVQESHAANELGARFDILSRYALEGGEMPPASTAEYATAYGDLLTLEWFLADVRRAIIARAVAL